MLVVVSVKVTNNGAVPETGVAVKLATGAVAEGAFTVMVGWSPVLLPPGPVTASVTV